MDDATLGRLTREKGEAEASIAHIRRNFTKQGQILQQLGELLQRQPEKLILTSAPDNLGEYTSDLRGGPSLNWNDFPEIRQIAQGIQDLRGLQRKLEDIDRRLG